MRVGLTYDLRSEYLAAGYGEEETAELDREDTIDALADAIGALGHRVDRIGGARDLVARLAAGSRWDLVFNIAEGIRGAARESQVPAILDVYGVPYTFSDPMVHALGLHKGITKLIASAAGLPTPRFATVSAIADVDAIDLPFPLFAKPVAEGSGKGVTPASVIADRGTLREVAGDLLSRFDQPVLVETYLPGREFTVGIVGTGKASEVLGVLEIELEAIAERDVYSYVNKEEYDRNVRYTLVADEEAREAAVLARSLWVALGGCDAGRVDLRSDARGRPHLLEVNTLPGLNPVKSDLPILCRQLGMSYGDLIGRIVVSAQMRLRGERDER